MRALACLVTGIMAWPIIGCSSDSKSTTTVSPAQGTDSDSSSDGAVPATNGGSSGSGGTAGSGGATTGTNACEIVKIDAKPSVADVLVVLDRSSSMCARASFTTIGGQGGCTPDPGQPDRWTPSVNALKQITTALEDRLAFGLVMFPTAQGSGLSLCATGDFDVLPSLNNAAAIAEVLDMTSPFGRTPTAPALEAAKLGLSALPNEEGRERVVLLVTDGAPNCNGDLNADTCRCGSGDGCDGEPQKCLDEGRTFAAVDALREAGVRTYVVGYDTQGSDYVDVLDEMAKRGGTGDTQHRPVEDGAGLVSTLSSITATLASCTYQLAQAPSDPSYVRVTLDGVDRKLDRDFKLSGDTVELTGAACELLQNGAAHTLQIQVECEPVVII